MHVYTVYCKFGKNSSYYSGIFLPCRKKWFDGSRIWRKCSFATNTCFPVQTKCPKSGLIQKLISIIDASSIINFVKWSVSNFLHYLFETKKTWRAILQNCERKLVADNAIFQSFSCSGPCCQRACSTFSDRYFCLIHCYLIKIYIFTRRMYIALTI